MNNNWEFYCAEQQSDSEHFQNQSLDFVMNILNDSPQRKSNLDFTYQSTNIEYEKKSEGKVQNEEYDSRISERLEQSSEQKKLQPEIQICTKKKIYFSLACYGRAGETLNLSKYFHQETSKYLKKLKICKSLKKDELKEVDQYFQINCSLQSQLEFFKRHEDIKKYSCEFYNSPQFMKNVLNSPKMFFERKLVILKNINNFLEIIQSGKIVSHWSQIKN